MISTNMILLGVVLLAAGLAYYYRDYLFGKQKYTSLPYSANNNDYYQTPVDSYGMEFDDVVDPHDENQPLERGVDIHQGPHPDVIPGQYDSASIPMKSWSDPGSSKYRSVLTENGDMIARRAIDGIH